MFRRFEITLFGIFNVGSHTVITRLVHQAQHKLRRHVVFFRPRLDGGHTEVAQFQILRSHVPHRRPVVISRQRSGLILNQALKIRIRTLAVLLHTIAANGIIHRHRKQSLHITIHSNGSHSSGL